MISVAKHFFNPTSSSKYGQYSLLVASLVSPLLYISNKKCTFIRLGSYRCESTPSRPIWQVKHSWARLVLGWETSWESRVLQAFFDHLLIKFLIFITFSSFYSTLSFFIVPTASFFFPLFCYLSFLFFKWLKFEHVFLIVIMCIMIFVDLFLEVDSKKSVEK